MGTSCWNCPPNGALGPRSQAPPGGLRGALSPSPTSGLVTRTSAVGVGGVPRVGQLSQASPHLYLDQELAIASDSGTIDFCSKMYHTLVLPYVFSF